MFVGVVYAVTYTSNVLYYKVSSYELNLEGLPVGGVTESSPTLVNSNSVIKLTATLKRDTIPLSGFTIVFYKSVNSGVWTNIGSNKTIESGITTWTYTVVESDNDTLRFKAEYVL